MRCLITGCEHTQSRRGRIDPPHNSWGKYQICPCCANELIYLGLVTSIRVAMNACRYLLKAELEPPPKKRDVPLKKKSKFTHRRWVKYHGPPVPTELL